MKNWNAILTKLLYQHYHQVKLINMNFLQVKKHCIRRSISVQSRIIGQARFIYSLLGKAFEKQIKTIKDQERKQVKSSKAIKPEENQKLETNEGFFFLK